MNGRPHVACPGALSWDGEGGRWPKPADGPEKTLPVPQCGRKRETTVVAAAVRFEQPRRFNWRRYEDARKAWSERIMLAGTLVSGLALVTLLWRMAEGEPVSHARWLLGTGSGFFVVWMLRLALFVVLSAPHFISFAGGRVRLSGLGLLRPEQILHWTVQPGKRRRRQKASLRIDIGCLWHGTETQWSIDMEEGAEAVQLQHWLKTACPHAVLGRPARASLRQEMEAGLMTVVGAVPGMGVRKA